MATVTQGSSESFTLDAFGYVTITQCGAGTLTGASHAPNLKSDVSYSKIAPIQYGPFGVPIDMTLTATDRDITYSTTAGYGGAITTNDDGVDVLIGPDGTEYPLPILASNQSEPLIGGVPSFKLTADAGSDVDHAQLIWTINCGLGIVPDDALASQRFVDYATNAEVFRSGIDGAGSSQQWLIDVPPGVSIVHFALAGAGSYTADADSTFGGSTMGVAILSEDDAPRYLMITALSAYKGGGTNFRYREINLLPMAV